MAIQPPGKTTFTVVILSLMSVPVLFVLTALTGLGRSLLNEPSSVAVGGGLFVLTVAATLLVLWVWLCAVLVTKERR